MNDGILGFYQKTLSRRSNPFLITPFQVRRRRRGRVLQLDDLDDAQQTEQEELECDDCHVSPSAVEPPNDVGVAGSSNHSPTARTSGDT
eukprot:2520869-Amphidinium_carterae.1